MGELREEHGCEVTKHAKRASLGSDSSFDGVALDQMPRNEVENLLNKITGLSLNLKAMCPRSICALQNHLI